MKRFSPLIIYKVAGHSTYSAHVLYVHMHTPVGVDVSVCVSVYTYICYMCTVHVLLGGLLLLLLFCVHTYMQ